MSPGTVFPTRRHVHPVNSQISQRIRAVAQSDQSLSVSLRVCGYNVVREPKRRQADSKDSNQILWLRRPI